MDDAPLAVIVEFLAEIAIPVRWDAVEGPTALPGITIDRGTLVVDLTTLRYPGDLLHEAGHLAVMPAEERARTVRDAGGDPAREMVAIAWSYAASCHLGLDPAVVFHEGGYRGGAQSLAENFSAGRYIGVPLLQWLGLAADDRRAAELEVKPYPAMLRWVL